MNVIYGQCSTSVSFLLPMPFWVLPSFNPVRASGAEEVKKMKLALKQDTIL